MIKKENALSQSDSDSRDLIRESLYRDYWRANILVVSALLFVWFLVSFVFGIFFSDQLNEIRIYGFKLGFWWAHQGSIFTFVLIIYVYSTIMARIDKRFHSKHEKVD
tara:strand:+ start:552 stop:872 length:321 start_codon:yes stop_codon:yes gene_type:complete